MKSRLITVILSVILSVTSLYNSHAQDSLVVADTVRKDFPGQMLELMKRNKNPNAIEIASAFESLWDNGSLSSSNKQLTEEIGEMMRAKRLSAIPGFTEYLRMIDLGVSTFKLTNAETDSMLTMTQQVLRYETSRDYITYLRNLNNFFSYNALYHSRYYRLYYSPGQITFDYIVGDLLAYEEIPLPEDIEEQEEDLPADDGWGDTTDDGWGDTTDDGWGDTTDDGWGDTTDDGWGNTTDDGWGTDDKNEDSGDDWGTDDTEYWGTTGDPEPDVIDPMALIDAYSDHDIPSENGAIIRIADTDLTFVTPMDSISIVGTSGSFLVNRNIFIGKGGSFDWNRPGLDTIEAYCTFDDYHFTVSKAELSVDKATLTYNDMLDESILGLFEFRSIQRKRGQPMVYPRFQSYLNDIRVKNLGDPELIYIGGFAMVGNKISGKSIIPGISTIEIQDAAGPLFRVKSANFIYEDSLISCTDGSLTVYQGSDSITHPSVSFRYYTSPRKMVAVKNKITNNLTPFKTSFYRMNITADMISWDIDEDSLDFSILNARNLIPAYFESIDYFNRENLKKLSGIYNFNPLLIVVNYSNKIKQKEFNVYDMAAKLNLNEKTVKASMLGLAEIGFIEFNESSGDIKVNNKAYHYVKAYRNKKDFDDLLIKSITSDIPNASLNIRNNELTVRGIEKFYISELLDVIIYPDSNEITFFNQRDFRFNGQLLAGNFEFAGRNFLFNYDSFYVDMEVIDSIRFYIDDPESGSRRKVDNKLVSFEGSEEEKEEALGDLSSKFEDNKGRVYINRPDNKSGRKIYPTYPMFNAGKGAVVYFDGDEVLDGAYDETVYFVIPPFKIDSLSDSDPTSVGFDGMFVSNGILPTFEETLHIMDDYSLGFNHVIAPEGYELYGGSGKIYNKLKMDQNGLVADGHIEYMTSSMESVQLSFYLDSLAGTGARFNMRPGDHETGSFPDAIVDNFHLKWIPRKDSMYISNIDIPISLYQATATLDGTLTVNKAGGFGKGDLLTRGSESRSDQFNFNENHFGARGAYFEVKTDNPEKPALTGDDVKLDFNLEENYANISPEVEGMAAIEFPYAQFKTSISNARWDLDEERVVMTKPENVLIENSYFYATREELDSLVFNATQAVYNMRSEDLRISGIPYIKVADAKITPENNEVLILENAIIGTLKNTSIVIDTLNEYHSLFNGTIDILSRNKFEGSATYEFVNAVGDTFAIKIDEFELVEEEGRGRDRPLHTRAWGYIAEGQDVDISPGMVYRGDVIMYAPDPAFELDGFIKLRYRDNPDGELWIKFQRTETETEEVQFDFEKARTESDENLTAGLHYGEDDRIYGTFINDKASLLDRDFFLPQGMLFYDEDSSMYRIEDTLKINGNSYSGKVFSLNVKTNDINFEGPIDLQLETKDMEIKGAAIGKGNLETNEFSMNSFLTFDFKITPTAMLSMATDVLEITESLGAYPAYDDDPSVLYKLAEIIGERPTVDFEKLSLENYVPLVTLSPLLVKTLVISDVNLKYTPNQKAWYSEGPIGVANIMRDDVNTMIDGFIEIKKTENGDVVNIFLLFSPDVWYYFNFDENRMITTSSNNDYNSIIADKSTFNKAGFGEYYVLDGEFSEAISFIENFRKAYYGIDEPFDLQYIPTQDEATFIDESVTPDSGAIIPEEVKEEEETEDDDGF